MRYFAEVSVAPQYGPPGVVRSVFPWDVPGCEPRYAPGTVEAYEVTGYDPVPAPGWTWDGHAFHPPAADQPPPQEPPLAEE